MFSAAFKSGVQSIKDAYKKYVTLLVTGRLPAVPFDTDTSTNNFPLTVANQARPTSLTPFDGAYYSASFNGTTDYVYAASSTFNVVNNFTIECWFYANTLTASNAGGVGLAYIGNTSSADGLLQIGVNTDGSTYFYMRNNSAVDVMTATSAAGLVTTGGWHHIAFVKNGTAFRTYLNGVSVAVAVSSTTMTYASTFLYIGFLRTSSLNQYWNGYISNFRLVNGTAVYTSNFTPPTSPLTAITNTQLLTLQSNRFIDNSGIQYTVAPSGQPTISQLTPLIDPSAAQSAYYGSAFFDGTGDYITAPSNAAFNLTNQDFTIEFFAYDIARSSSGTIWLSKWGTTASLGRSYNIAYTSAGTVLGFSVSSDGSTFTTVVSTSAPSLNLNAWNHIAVTRSSNVFRLFVNGVAKATATNTISLYSTSLPLCIGANYEDVQGSGNTYATIGYISNLRIVKGTAVYTSNFTPPTAPLTPISGTSLLTLQSNQSDSNNYVVDSSPLGQSIGNNGVVAQGSFSPYRNEWATYFNGTSDYLSIPSSTANTLGTSDFTIELWFNSAGTNAYPIFAGKHTTASQLAWTLGLNNNYPYFVCNNSYAYTHSTRAAINTWNHFAVCRSGSSVYVSLNGQVELVPTPLTGTILSIGSVITIGYNTYLARYFNGAISDFRMIVGTALYTSTFSPPTTQLTATVNTRILTCQGAKFIDNSPSQHAITIVGAPVFGNASPIAPSTISPISYSNYFPGNSAYIQVPNAASNQLGSGNWTAEAWIYITTATSINPIFAKGGATTDWFLATDATTGRLYCGISTTDYFTSTGPVVSLNTWHHVALVRSGSTLTTYLDGVVGNTQTGITQTFASTGALNIGRGRDTSTNYFSGCISNARIVAGTALYTSNFTPPTSPLTAISGTQLLTCQSSALIDNSVNKAVVSSFNNVGIKAANPFSTPVATSSQVAYSPTLYGGSLYFNGVNTFYTPTSTAVALGAGMYTVSFWLYTSNISNGATTAGIFDSRTTASTAGGTAFYYSTASGFIYRVAGSLVLVVSLSASGFVNNAWNHIAIVRDSTNTLALFINGNRVATGTNTANHTLTSFKIGKTYDNTYYQGYMSDFQMIVGTAVYTANFTPPTAPAVPLSTSKLLLSGANAGVYDTASTVSGATNGATSIATAQNKYGNSSLYFSGASTNVLFPYTIDHEFAYSDFTIELWVYRLPGAMGMLVCKGGGLNIAWASYELYVATTDGRLNFAASSANTGYDIGGEDASNGVVGTIPDSVWTHVAATRSGNVFRAFINGVQGWTQTSGSALYNSSPRGLAVGSNYSTTWGTTTPATAFAGYINDLRITKGIARYVGNFVPPQQAFTLD